MNTDRHLRWWKQPGGALMPHSAVRAGTHVHGQAIFQDAAPTYLTVRVMRPRWFRRSLHVARPNFQEPGTVARITVISNGLAQTEDPFPVPSAGKIGGKVGYRLYDDLQGRSDLLLAVNTASVEVSTPTGGITDGELAGSLGADGVKGELKLSREGRRMSKATVNATIDPELDTYILTPWGEKLSSLLEFVRHSFAVAVDEWKSLEATPRDSPSDPDELLDVFKKLYAKYLPKEEPRGWGVELQSSKLALSENESAEIACEISVDDHAEAGVSLAALAVRNTADPEDTGLLDVSDFFLISYEG